MKKTTLKSHRNSLEIKNFSSFFLIADCRYQGMLGANGGRFDGPSASAGSQQQQQTQFNRNLWPLLNGHGFEFQAGAGCKY